MISWFIIVIDIAFLSFLHADCHIFYAAQRLKNHFPTLLGEKYSPEKFKFEFTSRERTRSTAESFAQGLFGDKCKYFYAFTYFPLHNNVCLEIYYKMQILYGFFIDLFQYNNMSISVWF